MRNDGGPAFPIEYAGEDGMSIRDYFAAAVLHALFTTYAPIEDRNVDKIAIIATAAYELADAMLKAREK